MRYVVLMNHQYINSFREYKDAYELSERLMRRYITAEVEIRIYEG